MSDPTQPTESTSRAEWRDQRAEMRDEKRAHRDAMRGEAWPGIPIAGAIVIAVGVIFLLGNFGLHLPPRWWAVFILVPAAGALVTATRFFRADGGFSSRAAGATTSGALMLAVALILFLNLSWAAYWPVLVIIVGLGIVVRGSRRRF